MCFAFIIATAGYYPYPAWGMADDVLLREGPQPFELQNASHHHRRSLAATNHLPALSQYAYRALAFMDTALGCSLGLIIPV